MKNFVLSITVIVTLIVALTGTAFAGEEEIEIYIDGEPVEPEQSPYLDENNRTLVPLRFISEQLGAKVDWNSTTETITVNQDFVVREEIDDEETDGMTEGERQFVEYITFFEGFIITEDFNVISNFDTELIMTVDEKEIESQAGIVPFYQKFNEEFMDKLDDDHPEEFIKEIIEQEPRREANIPSELDTEPVIKNGRTMVPLRIIGEAFDAQVAWDDNTIYIDRHYDLIDEQEYEQYVMDYLDRVEINEMITEIYEDHHVDENLEDEDKYQEQEQENKNQEESVEDITDLSAMEIAVRAEEYMEEQNTYQSNLEGLIKLDISFSNLSESEASFDEKIPEIEIPVTAESNFRHDPMALYAIQEYDLKTEELPSIANMGLGLDSNDKRQELYITEDKIYQKMEAEQWVKPSLLEKNVVNNMHSFASIEPTKFLEMVEKFGISYDLAGVEEIEGDEHFVLNLHINEEDVKAIMEKFMDEDFQDIMTVEQQMKFLEDETKDEELGQMKQEVTEIKDVINNLSLDLDHSMYINKESFETKAVTTDLNFEINLSEEQNNQEIEVDIDMSMETDMELFNYGEDLDFPETDDAITMEEYREKMMENEFDEELEENIEGQEVDEETANEL
ncbi:copper amine oxidase N-terminal domain-containing protein [Natranaerobius thermophilus]|uniref:Copper amine oxidase domain protein n=1 Tax=Natranaerobius thermophilus (strain ATCC BAA-1301 / DSM 18059 / JW/NM-WN-LF) TaxID=457570 RepID=B2A297_NATTJ|nr:copper amine oxidase N-terminal domain-containing protein [Natranaerobius thermophilus]ACB86203.1 copper amine oxidase domain protein [Natranaerobius thermophilus JW/NM-WN-LF]